MSFPHRQLDGSGSGPRLLEGAIAESSGLAERKFELQHRWRSKKKKKKKKLDDWQSRFLPLKPAGHMSLQAIQKQVKVNMIATV